MVPYISPSGGSPVILIPLVFVVAINGLKDFYEDYKRKESDNRENYSKVKVLNDKEKKDWENISTGMIVKVKTTLFNL